MNIEARKISLVQKLFSIQKPDILDKIEEILNKNTTTPHWHKEIISSRLDSLDKKNIKNWESVEKRLDSKYEI